MPALNEWIDALGYERANTVAEESELDCIRIFKGEQRKLDPRFLIPGLSELTRQAVLHTLIYTITLYLDNQQAWLELAPRGQHTLLLHVGISMWAAAQHYTQQTANQIVGKYGVSWYFDFLSVASEFYFTNS